MRKLNRLILFLLLLFNFAYAKQINVYAASDLVFAFSEIKKIYEKMYPEDSLKIIFGSSGKGYHQALNGAPYDVMFLANISYVELLKEKGVAISKILPYAYGRIVIWTRKDSGISLKYGINAVLNPKVKKIAVANWQHAPYGLAAKECLQHFHLFEKIKDKMVLGENVSQTAQFVEIGAVDVGFIAYSLAKSERLKKEGRYYLLPSNCHNPIKQGAVVLKHALEKEGKYKTALRFFNFMQTEEVRKILNKYGFELPDE